MLILSSSSIGSIFFKGDIRTDWCPLKWKDRFIDGNKAPLETMSEPKRNGSYFEYIIGVNPYSEVTDIPNIRISDTNPIGEIPVAKKRLIAQKGKFFDEVHKCGIQLGPNHVQQRLMMPWEPEGYRCPECKSKDITIVPTPGGPYHDYAECKCGYSGESTDFCIVRIEGSLDILSKLNYFNERGESTFYPIANIDVKTCGDIDSTYHDEYQWGNPMFRDHFQMDLYSYIFYWMFGAYLPAFYMVFDWKAEENKKGEKHVGFKWVQHIVTQESHYVVKETIRKAIEVIKKQVKAEWRPVGSYSACNGCRLASTCQSVVLNKNETV
jgi:hypothetical protein